MHRIQKLLLGVFCGGVLLGGIGTGVAFVEYSSITYAGEKKIGQENLITEELDFTFQPEQGGIMVAGRRYEDGQPYVVEEDMSIPENVIRYQVTYNPENVTPELVFYEAEQENSEVTEDGWEEEMGATAGIAESTGTQGNENQHQEMKYQGELRLDTWYHGDSFALWMKNKDEILKDLKQRTIASYRVDYVTAVKIKVNPRTMQYVKKVN